MQLQFWVPQDEAGNEISILACSDRFLLGYDEVILRYVFLSLQVASLLNNAAA